MKQLQNSHPLIALTYFVSVIVFTFIHMHPIVSLIALMASISYAIILSGRTMIKFVLKFMLPVALFTIIINPLISHDGVSIIGYIPGGSPITKEAILYGIATATMIISVIGYFSSFQVIMTSDKFMYLFGKISPTLSLIFSMVLSFVPKFKTKIKNITASRKALYKNDDTSAVSKAKDGIKILSAMTIQSLENAVDTADSMKCRGYGGCKRSYYTNYRLNTGDIISMIYLLALTVYVCIGSIEGSFYFKFYPSIQCGSLTVYDISVFTAYIMLCFYPVIIEVKEAIRWKILLSKI